MDPVTAMLLGSLVSAGAGMFSAHRSGKAAEGATEMSETAALMQMAQAQKEWDRYMTTFAPVEDQVGEQLQKPMEQQAGYLRGMGQINRGYNDAGGNLNRAMAGKYASGSGLGANAGANLGLMRSRDQAGFGADYQSKLNQQRMQFAGQGRGLASMSSNNLAGAAGTYSNLANMYGGQAEGGYASAGNIMGNLMLMKAMQGGAQADPVTKLP